MDEAGTTGFPAKPRSNKKALVFRFEHSQDAALIRSLLAIPECYRRMVHDDAPPVNLFDVSEWPPNVEAIVARELTDYGNGTGGWEPIALFLLVDRGERTAEVHFCFVPLAWGRTLEIARAFLAGTWCEGNYDRLLGPVPSYNRLALRLAHKAGFQNCGVTRALEKRHGRPFDLIWTELRRPL